MDRRGFFSALTAPLVMSTHPGVLLTKDEVIVPLSKGRQLTQTIVVELDAKKLMKAVMRELPNYIHTRTV